MLGAVRKPTRREFRDYITLCPAVDSPDLRGELRRMAASEQEPARRHARWMLVGLGERRWDTGLSHPGILGLVTYSEPDFDLEFWYPLKGLSKAPTTLESNRGRVVAQCG